MAILPFFSVVEKEVKANLDMFSLGVLHRVLRDGDCTCVVAEDRGIGEFVSVIQQLILIPEDLSIAATSSYIFGFSGGNCNGDLLLAGPADEPMTEKLTSTRSAFAINRTTSMISVCIADEIEGRIAWIPNTESRGSF